MILAVIPFEQGFEASASCFEDVVVADDGARGHGLNKVGFDGRPLTYLSAMSIAGIGESVLSRAFLQAGGSARCENYARGRAVRVVECVIPAFLLGISMKCRASLNLLARNHPEERFFGSR